tara:strand:+ start:101 stop:928 length:828 start_codon:yes stop_codon:yes gene_type:complete
MESNDFIELSGFHIPRRFFKKIRSHVFLRQVKPGEIPIFYGIIGPPGSGKSLQLAQCLAALKVDVTTLHASDLASYVEGGATDLLKNAFQSASLKVGPAALIINDFDLSLANIKPGVDTSQHTQLLRVAMMEIADQGLVKNSQYAKLPVFLTINSLDGFYKPLVREGRMRILRWEMSRDEKKFIVGKIFLERTEAEIQKLVSVFDSEQISFFSALKSEVLIHLAEDAMQELDGIRQYSAYELSDIVDEKFSAVKLGAIVKMGKAVISSRQSEDYV